jgi:hypothetical protein
MEKLNDYIQSLNSDKYKKYLEDFGTHFNGDILFKIEKKLPYIEKNKKEVIILPEYDYVENVLNNLQEQRNKEFFNFRFLRNKLIFDTQDKMIKDKYNSVLEKLKTINNEIELFETYKRVLYHDIRDHRKNLKHHVKNLIESIKIVPESKKHIRVLKDIKKKEEELKNAENIPINYYIKREPYWMVLKEEDKPKIVRKIKKTKKGGGSKNLLNFKNYLKKIFLYHSQK